LLRTTREIRLTPPGIGHWRLVVALQFDSQEMAIAFEKYLKSARPRVREATRPNH
jgi:hypothetical protein